MSHSELSLKIVRTQDAKEDGKPFTFYLIQVGPDGDSCTMVLRRYRDFEALHKALMREFPLEFDIRLRDNVAKLPGKKVFGNLDKLFIEQRRAALESYLQSLCRIRPVVESDTFNRFLELL